MKKHLAVLLCVALALPSIGSATVDRPAASPPVAQRLEALREYLQKSYLTLFELAPGLEVRPDDIAQLKKELEEAKDSCRDRFKESARQLEKQIRKAQAELADVTWKISKEERDKRHCEIENLRAQREFALMLSSQGIPVAFDNKEAKLTLIQQWPQDLQRIRQALATGTYRTREFADVHDIGFRNVGPGQSDDVDDGEQAVEQMRRAGLLPKPIKNEAIQRYVTDLARRIAQHSDLQVPLKVEVLESPEINAFALPGGFLFVERGVLETVQDEAMLAGVIAHEIAHAAARHGHKLMEKAQVASLLLQAAEIAAAILTGGASLGTLQAVSAGLQGLGLALNLTLLGVSREFELEADQLGVQYAWNSGHDPTGFIRMFDQMATMKGYVEGASWFRTHPPFYDRMVQSQTEIMFLPPLEGPVVQTAAFEQMKRDLAQIVAEAQKEEEGRPSLRAPGVKCPASGIPAYKPGQPIDSICPLPGSHTTRP